MPGLTTGQDRGRTQRTQRGRRALIAAALVMAVFLSAAGVSNLNAQGSNPKEYQVKALFIFNFIQFVEWPAAAFPDAASPIRIGVLGDDPFAGGLEAAVRGETVRQRPLVIARAARVEELQNCHVLFVSRSERPRIPGILSALEGKPILTVGDQPDFARRGGMINFYLEGHKVRFEINRAAAQRGGLKLSSQLLGLARLVGPALAGGDR